jgi:hypothetical protein
MYVNVKLWMRAAMSSAVVLCPVSSSSCSVYCGDCDVDVIVGANEEVMSLLLNVTKYAYQSPKAAT